MQPIDEPALTAELIRARSDALRARLRSAAERAGRDPDAFRVVAVTKGFGVAVVRAAAEAGLTLFGENRVQEAGPKVHAVPGVEWHLIGRLQSNKARPAARLFAAIHSVDSFDLLRRLDRIAREERLAPRLLLQVNVGGDERRAGLAPGWLREHAAELGGLAGQLEAGRLTGLMTMARLGAAPEEQHATFAALRGLRDELEATTGIGLPELSMGMTADAEAAVAEGATLVRVGTAIFGPRPDG